MQAHAFPGTSGARNPIAIVFIFIFIFFRLKVVGRLNHAREDGAIWRVGADSCEYLRHKKLHMCLWGGYNLGKHFFAFYLPNRMSHKPTFSNSFLGFCPICMKLGTYTL